MHIGIDIGGSHIGLVLVDNDFNILKKGFIQIKDEYKRLEKNSLNPAIINLIISSINNLKGNNEINSIGIGFPGLCDINKKHVIFTPNLNLDNNELIRSLQDVYIDIPVYIDCDANCSTLSEINQGALKNVVNGVFLAIGTGIGGGIVIDGKIYRGSSFVAGEFGHMVIVKDGIECNCGNTGCFEKYASICALRRQCKEAGYEFETVEEIFNSPLTKKIVEQWVEYLSIGIANIYNILDVEKIVIGGGASEHFDKYEEILIKKVKSKICNKEKIVDIEKSQMLNNAGAIGAAMLGCELDGK